RCVVDRREPRPPAALADEARHRGGSRGIRAYRVADARRGARAHVAFTRRRRIARTRAPLGEPLMSYALRFLGVGSAHATALGSANAVLERDGAPLLMIDCGPEGLTAYESRYGELPRALFVTHAHLDHVGGMERLFYRAYFDDA